MASGQTATGQTDGMAVASLVLGILSIPGALFYGVFGIILGAIAIFLGVVARGRIKRSDGTVTGNGLATAGLVLGICGAGLGLVLIALLAVFLITWVSTTNH